MKSSTSSTSTTSPPLRVLRQERGLTVDQVAHLAGTTKGTVSKFERGLERLPRQAVVDLSKALKVPVEKITG